MTDAEIEQKIKDILVEEFECDPAKLKSDTNLFTELDLDSIELCAGVIEPGETPEQGARRELLEETGYGGGTWQEIMTIGQNPSTCSNWTHCFLATGVEKLQDQNLDRTEDIDVLLLTRHQVLQMLQSGQLKQALMLAPLWQYFAQSGQCAMK